MDRSNSVLAEDHNEGETRPVEDLDEFPEIRCDLCDMVFTDVPPYKLHINGKRHNKKVQTMRMKQGMKPSSHQPGEASESADGGLPDSIYCALCKLHCSGYVPYKQHLKSSKHLRQINKDQLNEHLQNTPEVLAENNKSTERERVLGLPKSYGRCDVCCKTFFAPETLKQHMESPAHKKRVTQANLKMKQQGNIEKQADLVIKEEIADDDGIFIKCYAECKTCNKRFSGPESFQMHLASVGHEKKIEIQKSEEKMKLKNDGPGVIKDGKYCCKECGKTFGDFLCLNQHLYSNIHAKLNTKKEIEDFLDTHPEITKLPPEADEDELSDSDMVDFYVCKLCRSSFSGPECAKQHIMGKRHRRAMAIMKRLDAASVPASETKLKVTSTADHNDQSKDHCKDNDQDDFEIIH